MLTSRCTAWVSLVAFGRVARSTQATKLDRLGDWIKKCNRLGTLGQEALSQGRVVQDVQATERDHVGA